MSFSVKMLQWLLERTFFFIPMKMMLFFFSSHELIFYVIEWCGVYVQLICLLLVKTTTTTFCFVFSNHDGSFYLFRVHNNITQPPTTTPSMSIHNIAEFKYTQRCWVSSITTFTSAMSSGAQVGSIVLDRVSYRVCSHNHIHFIRFYKFSKLHC